MPADVPSAVATTLALQSAGSEDTTSLFAALSDQRALLLLDNCEHLIDGVIQFVSAVESHCDRITVLATSREALGLGHEVRLNLPPLDVIGDGGTSDAMRMFCERAAAVLGSFQPSEADVEVIDEICRRLDGLPLAIELATARLSAMTVPELRAHLDDRLDVLARRRGVNARHQSLRATVAWSYDLLSDVEQSFFDELSAFGADFGVDAARAVGGDTTVPVEDLLMSLVDKSLLTANRGPLGMRFRQLETVRQYGEARLQGRGGVPASMRRQLDHYVDVDRVRGRGHQESGRAALAPVVHCRMAQRAERVPVGLHGRRRRRRVPPRERNAVVGDDANATRGRPVVRAGTRDAVSGRPPAEAGRVGGRVPLRSHARRSRP